MPSPTSLVLTRNQQKRKALELQTNAPVKKARVSRMKELAEMYESGIGYDKNDNNNSNYFNKFFMKQKVVYPWLTKESLRWHVRVLKNSKKKLNKIATTTKESCDNKTRILESVVTDHSQEVRSYEI